ncbi:lysozyme, partial [Campylobacter helveticus]
MSLKKIKETIFAYDKEVIDCEILRAKNIDIINSSIYLCGVKLQGSQELPNHPFFFGELDKEGNIKQEQPSYYFAPKDETLDKGKLTIYLHNL